MVLIQAGHLNIQTNCDASLRSGTGAPQEVFWTPQIAQAIVSQLQARGVEAKMVDANFNCDPAVKQDYQAVVAVHYQANLPTASGYYCGAGDPAQDGAAQQSAALVAAIRRHYEASTGLAPRPEWNNANITHYYLFESLSGPTPFGLIECGVGATGAPDHDFLWSPAGQQKVADGIATGILDFLRVAPPPDPAAELRAQLAAAKQALADSDLALRLCQATYLQQLRALGDVVDSMTPSDEVTGLKTTLDAIVNLVS